MRNYLRKILFFTSFLIQYLEANNINSHTFFTVRPQWQSDMPEKISFFHNNLFNDYGSAFEVAVFGGRSTNSTDLAKYYLPFNSCSLQVAEAKLNNDDNIWQVDPEAKRENVIAQNINIATKEGTFSSIVTLNPRQTVYGIGLDYKQRLGSKWWLEISMPIERVHNTLDFKETIINDGGGVKLIDGTDTPEMGLDNSSVVANATQAFTQKSWNYGRMCNQQARWGLADIELKLGLISCTCDIMRASSYAGLLFPTGNKPKGHVVFEEIVGNNRHFGFMFGQNIGIDFGRRAGFDFSVELDLNSTYLFSNTQTRSIDPYDKSFGRYLATYSSSEQAAAAASSGDVYTGTSGINVFTKRVTVCPRGFIDINTGLVFKRSAFAAELGFNIYARQSEHVSLKDCLVDGIAIKDIAGSGITNPTRGINTLISNAQEAYSADAYTTNEIHSRGLNLESASHPATIANILYASLGYKGDHSFLNFGGSYEHGHVNTTLKRWLGWGKIGLTF